MIESDRFYSARVSICSYKSHAHCMLFVLMKTLARNKEKLRQKQDKGEISDTQADYELKNMWLSVVLVLVVINCCIISTFCQPRRTVLSDNTV